MQRKKMYRNYIVNFWMQLPFKLGFDNSEEESAVLLISPLGAPMVDHMKPSSFEIVIDRLLCNN